VSESRARNDCGCLRLDVSFDAAEKEATKSGKKLPSSAASSSAAAAAAAPKVDLNISSGEEAFLRRLRMSNPHAQQAALAAMDTSDDASVAGKRKASDANQSATPTRVLLLLVRALHCSFARRAHTWFSLL